MSSTIAVVDDDASVRAALGSLLRSLGFAVLTFPSAEAFLSAAPTSGIACLISDVQMPGMSGPELQRRLQDDGRGLPTIFVTAFPEERIRRLVEGAGAYGFLAKPFESNALISCLEAALGAKV